VSATVDYTFAYANVAPVQSEAQVVSPLVAENGSSITMLGAPFTISPATAVSATVDWTTLSHENVTVCTRVFLQTPAGVNFNLKPLGVASAKPYNVLNVYRHANGGAGQYRIGIEEATAGGCRNQVSLTGATMTVTDAAPTGSWSANAQVSLWDGTTAHVLKPFGAADAAPYDVRGIYNASGPGTYSIRVEENNGGGEATLSEATLSISSTQCDAGCGITTAAAPPVADGSSGAPMRLGKGAGPSELTIAIDDTTCSSTRAVVLFGNIGNYTGYQGAVTGCDIGGGPTGTFTAPSGSVWFNVLWVNDTGAAGHPGTGSGGSRTWDAAGFCGVVADDPSDATCN
jgi:hypothetical protein